MNGMLRIAALLSLFVAFTGTPLRQAEAAADFARSLAEALEPAELETPDGGVGDDSGDTVLNGSHASLTAPLPASLDSSLPPPPPVGLYLNPDQTARLRERVWQPTHPPALRHAWLQVFLF